MRSLFLLAAIVAVAGFAIGCDSTTTNDAPVYYVDPAPPGSVEGGGSAM